MSKLDIPMPPSIVAPNPQAVPPAHRARNEEERHIRWVIAQEDRIIHAINMTTVVSWCCVAFTAGILVGMFVARYHG